MLDVYERLGTHCHHPADQVVVLTQEQRDKGRLKLNSQTGEEVRVFLERGNPLRVGEFLKSTCGQLIRVEGALEPVAIARCNDWQTFARACYHLGNRHTKVEVGARWLRIKPDHVLEEMLMLLGLTVQHENSVFAPESGAYSHHGHHAH